MSKKNKRLQNEKTKNYEMMNMIDNLLLRYAKKKLVGDSAAIKEKCLNCENFNMEHFAETFAATRLNVDLFKEISIFSQ